MTLGLGEVTDFQAGPELEFAPQGFDLAQQGTQEGRFAGAIGADQGGALVAIEGDLVGLEEGLARIADQQISGLQDLVRKMVAGLEAHCDLFLA